MPSSQGRWAIAKPSKVIVDPYFSTLTGYQREADRKQITARKNQPLKAARVPQSRESSGSNSQNRRRNRIGPESGEEPKLTESSQACQKKDNGKTSVTDTEQVRDKKHERRPGRQARVKRRNRKAQKSANASPVAGQVRLQAYKAAGLNTKGLWSFSQRNRAKALAQIEPPPNIDQNDLVVAGK